METFSLDELDIPEPSPELLAALMDPERWRATLETYATTVKIAVGLTDCDGRELAACCNPQPTWQLARQTSPAPTGECSFCLAPAKPCRAVAESITLRRPVITEDQAGLAHVAVPVILGGRIFGALVAGQVFSRYPEPLSLQRVAKDFGIPRQKLWNQAVLERPVSRPTLLMYGNLLMTLGRDFLGTHFASLLHGRLISANEKIERSLGEKEVLLKEIQHRVKNNLQIVASLLSLQSSSLDSAKDVRTIQALRAGQQRIEAMAEIHNLLYSNARIGEIDLGPYIRSLTEKIISSIQSNHGNIHSHFTLTLALISLRQAILCGLIVAELVTNAFKYAYANDTGGGIYVSVSPAADDTISVAISDHGAGMPESLDWRNSPSLGLRIVCALARQLRGTLDLDTHNGTAFTLRFPKEPAAGS